MERAGQLEDIVLGCRNALKMYVSYEFKQATW